MTGTIKIGDKMVRLRYSAGIPRLYRIKFRSDIFADLQKAIKNTENPQLEDLTVLENVAYIMAKHADVDESGKCLNTVPNTVEEWLETFEGVFDIYSAMPEIFKLWGLNIESISESKKKLEKQNEK